MPRRLLWLLACSATQERALFGVRPAPAPLPRAAPGRIVPLGAPSIRAVPSTPSSTPEAASPDFRAGFAAGVLATALCGAGAAVAHRRAGLPTAASADRREVQMTATARPSSPRPFSVDKPFADADADAALAEECVFDPVEEVCALPERPAAAGGTLAEAYGRGRWLLGLLVLQSLSSFVLENYEDLVRDNIVITLFLTMLVGAGGNAGNQSAIHVIRGLATGEMETSNRCMRETVGQQLKVGALLGGALAAGGFLRVWVTMPPDSNLVGPLAIGASLFGIVLTSTLVGSSLPFVLSRLNQDPANAGTTVQVFMDVLGVLITCSVYTFVLAHAQDWGILQS